MSDSALKEASASWSPDLSASISFFLPQPCRCQIAGTGSHLSHGPVIAPVTNA